MDDYKTWQSTLEEPKQERLKRVKREWCIQQKYIIWHEKRKQKMIEEFERNYKKDQAKIEKQKSLYKKRSKSNSPQRRKTSFPDYEHFKERKASVIANGPEGIFIDKKELHKIKINIYKESNLPTTSQSTSNKIERNILNPDDIILPRRQNEGACPIFQKNEVKTTEEIRTITFLRNEQLEKQLSTSRKNIYTHRRPDNDMIQHYCDSSSCKSTIRQDDRTDNDNKYNRDRKRNSSTKNSKEKDRGRNERRDGSTSCYNNRSASFRNHSRSRYRSRSHSPISGQTKERIDNDRNKFLFKRSCPDQSREFDNRVIPKLNDPYSFPNNVYNPYMCLLRPMPILRMQTPPMLMPVFPGPFSAPFPINLHRQPPPNSGHQWQRNWNPRYRY